MKPNPATKSPKPTTNGAHVRHEEASSDFGQEEGTMLNGSSQDIQTEPSKSPGESLEELLAVLQKARTLSGFSELKSLIEANQTLRARLAEEETVRKVMGRESLKEAAKQEQLDAELKASLAEVHQLQTKLKEETKDAAKKIAAAESKIQNAEDNVKQLEDYYNGQDKELSRTKAEIITANTERDQARSNEATAKKEVLSLEARLKKMDDIQLQLSRIQSFGLRTQKVEVNASEHVRSLKALFDAVKETLQTLVFRREVDFAGGSLDDFDRYKSQRLVKALRIPLPSSNSLLSKQMRFASACGVLGRVLVVALFQPIYISSGKDWINDSLRHLDEDDQAEREHHVRSTLLNIAQNDQRHVGEERADRACQEAMGILKLVVAQDSHEDLRTRLQNVFDQALELWLKLQRVEEHIVPELSIGDDDEWKPLPLPVDEGSGASSSRPQPFANENSRAAQKQESMAGPVVWPAFTFDTSLLAHGYYLKRQLAIDAKNEERAAEDEAQERDARRLSQRKDSISAKRKDLKPFLLPGSS